MVVVAIAVAVALAHRRMLIPGTFSPARSGTPRRGMNILSRGLHIPRKIPLTVVICGDILRLIMTTTTESCHLRLPRDLIAALKRLASVQDRSFNNLCAMLLRKAVEK